MKVTKINLVGASTIELPIAGVDPSSRYILAGADGLGPTEAVVSIGKTRNQPGVFQDRQFANRQMVVRIKLNPLYAAGESASDLRDEIYGLLAPPANVDGHMTFDLFTLDPGNAFATVDGWVQRCEIVPFSKDPEVQVTLQCTSPYFAQKDTLYYTYADVSVFNPVLESVGTAPSGFVFGVVFTADLPDPFWAITNDETDEVMQFDFDFLTGDYLYVDTRPGTRKIQITRAGNTFDVIGVLRSDSSWLTLRKGENRFTTTLGDFDWSDLFYIPQYWGI